MANELGMTQSAYSKVENDIGDLTLAKLTQIAGILGVSIEDILGFNEGIVFNLKNNKKANGVVINQMSGNERKVYENYIDSLKAEIANLKVVLNKVLDNKPIKK